MAGFIYVNKDTGLLQSVNAIADREDTELILVESLPPNKDYKWSVIDQEWQRISVLARQQNVDEVQDPIFKGFTDPAEEIDLPQSIVVEPNTDNKIAIYGDNFNSKTAIALIDSGEEDENKGFLVKAEYNPGTNKINLDLNADSEAGYFSTSKVGTYDLIALNSDGGKTKLEGAIVIEVIPWIDLRLNGTPLNESELTYAERLTYTRTAEGMRFSGDTGWDTWAYFKLLEHPRSQKKTYEWIFVHTTGSMMIGIGGANADPNTTQAYYEAEIVGYFNSQTSFNRLYGDRSNGGSRTTVTASGVKKLILENNGEGGYKYFIYEIPSADPADWRDTSSLKGSGIIPSVFKESDSPIAPYFTPDSSTHQLIAVRVN